jgi:hypothetical protein
MHSSFRIALIFAAISVALPSPGIADTPSNVRDLVGARAAGGETALGERGYINVKTRKNRDEAWSYWWNRSRKECLMVSTYDGRYDKITTTTSGDCNQSDGNAGAAIAAAAIIGALVIAHNAQDHNDKQHSRNASTEADFDAGFRDGQYNYSYSPANRSDSYADGYEEGVKERENNAPHRRENGGSYNQSHNVYGGAAKVAFDDLNGARAAGATDEMSRRGFDNVDAFKQDSTAYTIWYNSLSRQCVQMTVTDGKVYDVRDINTHPKCR